MLSPCFAMQYLVSFLFCNHLFLLRKIELVVFLLSCSCKFYVSLSHDAVGWFAVCTCDIIWSYSLNFGSYHLYNKQHRSALLCKLRSGSELIELFHNKYCYRLADLF